MDSVDFACRDKLMKKQPYGAVRRAIILISDGEDNESPRVLPGAVNAKNDQTISTSLVERHTKATTT